MYPPSFSCVQMQCMSGPEFHPHQPNRQHASNPPPSFPESCGHQWAGRPQGVVGGGEVQAGDRNLQWHPWWPWAEPNLPTSRPAHHSSSLTAGETQPTSKAHHQPQAPEPTGRSLLSSEWPAPACGAVWPLYNPLRPAESSWAVRPAGPCHNPPVCGCPLRPRTAHNGGHGHEAAAGPPQPTATPPLWRAEQRAAASGEPATAHRSAAAEECAALQPPRRSAEVEQQ